MKDFLITTAGIRLTRVREVLMPSAVPQPAQTMNQQEPSKKASSMKVSDLEIRFLEATDYHNGFLQCLEFLTKVGPVTEHQFLERLAMFQRMPDLFKLRVVVDKRTGRVVGAGTLLIEPKFIHECGWTGHIEDIVVHEDARGLGLGKLIIQDLVALGKESGCYKVTLECSDDNVGFYTKCGFERKGNQMSVYF